jgi:hypothetical protein
MSMVFVDVEADGNTPFSGVMTEFGCVDFDSRRTFHGVLWDAQPDPANPAKPLRTPESKHYDEAKVFANLVKWLNTLPGRNVLVSDNPAYDFMWTAFYCDKNLGYNPFGHSGRRIADYYAGLTGKWSNTQRWKRLRITPHTHNPVDDAMGNVEAFARLQAGER